MEILKWIHDNMASTTESEGSDRGPSRKYQIGNILNAGGVATLDKSGADFKIKYIQYDWGNNSANKKK